MNAWTILNKNLFPCPVSDIVPQALLQLNSVGQYSPLGCLLPFGIKAKVLWDHTGPIGSGPSKIPLTSCRFCLESWDERCFSLSELGRGDMISPALKTRWKNTNYTFYCRICYCLVAKLCPALWDSINCSPPASFVRGIFQAKILEWVAISSSRGSSWSRDRTHISCIGRWILYH